MKATCYTDGSCKGNRDGGWGYHCLITQPCFSNFQYIDFEDFGGSRNTTNQMMELTAMLECFKFLNTFGTASSKRCISSYESITIYSDSKYTINGLVKEPGKKCTQIPDGWLKGWRSNGFKTTKKEPVLNLDIWLQLEKEYILLLKKCKSFVIDWVKGHSKNDGNDRADKLANKGVTTL